MLSLKCTGQEMKIAVDERIADKYINANTVKFEFCKRWAGMVITAQFTQNGKTYSVLVDNLTKTVTMPNEITVGEVAISAFGVHPVTGVRITSIPILKKVDKSGYVDDGETPIPPTPDLYDQLISEVGKVALSASSDIQEQRRLAVNEIHQASTDGVNDINITYEERVRKIDLTAQGYIKGINEIGNQYMQDINQAGTEYTNLIDSKGQQQVANVNQATENYLNSRRVITVTGIDENGTTLQWRIYGVI